MTRLFAPILALACGAPAASAPLVRHEAPEPAVPESFETATLFVEMLMARVERGEPIDGYVDHTFAERLPSGDELEVMLRAADCDIAFSESAGYSAVAIPPPMVGDPPEEIARIEAIIDELQAATEVYTECDGEAQFAITVRREGDSFRAMAWRDFRNEH